MILKKLSAVLLTVLMLLTVVTVPVFADGTVAKIGTDEYDSLADAIDAVPTDGTQKTIVIKEDIVIPENTGIKIAKGQNVVIDLNGKTVSGSDNTGKAFNLITNNGTLTIKDSSANGTGKISYTPKTPDHYNGYATDTIYNYNGTLTVKSGTIECLPTGDGTSYTIENSSNWGGKSVLNIEGGTVQGNDNVDSTIRVYMNGPATDLQAENTVNVSGGTIKGYFNVSSFSDCNGTKANVNLTGGTLENIFLKESTSTPDTFKADVNMTFSDDVEVTGAISQSGAYNIKEGFDIAVKGGTFGEDAFKGNISADRIAITGGTFADKESAEKYLEEGYAIGDDGKVEEAPKETVCTIYANEYTSLKDAIAAVPADGKELTIVIRKDIVIPENTGVKIAKGQNIVINLNGHTISGSDNTGKAFNLITNNGTLTIMDSSTDGTGKISYTPKTPDASYGYATDTIYNYNGTLTVKGGTIECLPVSGGTSYTIENSSNWGGKSVLNIEGGTIQGNDNVDSTIRVYMNGPATDLQAENTVNVSGGTIKGYFNVSSFSDCNGTKANVNLTGGTLENIFLKESTSTPDTFKADVNMTFSDDVEVTGEILQSGAYNIKEGFDISVEGGTFGEDAFKGNISTDRIAITGGTFADKESAAKYLSEGYVIGENGSVFEQNVEVKSEDTDVKVDAKGLVNILLHNDVAADDKVVLTVDAVEEFEDTAAATALNKVKPAAQSADLLEIDVGIYDKDDEFKGEVTDTNKDIIEIIIDFNDTLKTNIGVYSYHGSEVITYTEATTKKDGTFYAKDGKLHIFTTKFSSYMVTYDSKEAEIYASLSLQDYIELNIKIKCAEEDKSDFNVLLDGFGTVYNSGGYANGMLIYNGVYVFSPDELQEQVTITVKYKDEVIKTFDYSPFAYCYTVIRELDGQHYEKDHKDICAALLQYGAALEKNGDSFKGTFYSDKYLKSEEEYRPEGISLGDFAHDYALAGSLKDSLTVEGELKVDTLSTITLYIDAPEDAKVMVHYGEEYIESTYKDGKHVIEIGSIGARYLSRVYRVFVSSEDASGYFDYSVLTYCQVNQNDITLALANLAFAADAYKW